MSKTYSFGEGEEACCLCIRQPENGSDGRCTCQPKRFTPPLDYCQYEYRECFPCIYQPFKFFLGDRFPFVRWIKEYNYHKLISDIIAGLTVGLMVIPQGIAYASIAELPEKFGLYSAFMGCFVYVIFGTSKYLTLGPTAIVSLLTASITESCGDQEDRVQCAIALTLFSGIIQFMLGILNLGFLVDFIPVPVISGFTSAAAITIAIGQVKHLFGISSVRRPVYLAVYDIFAHIRDTKPGDISLGICCIALVVFLKYFKTHVENLRKSPNHLYLVQKGALKLLWILCTARNALVVLVAALIGYSLKAQGAWFHDQLTLVDYQDSSFPPFKPPDLTLKENATSPATLFRELGIGIGVTPLISFLEAIAIAKAFARKDNYNSEPSQELIAPTTKARNEIEPNQELIALGISNIASSFVSSYPVTGSFSRTAVNAQSGVRTQAAGIITGGVVLLAIGVLSPGFDYIPRTALAAIIIAAVLPVVELRIVCRITKLRCIDVVPLIISFFFTLFLGIEWGVPIAVVVYVLFLLYRHARPRHELSDVVGVDQRAISTLNGINIISGAVVQVRGSEVFLVFNGGWNFPGVEYIWKRVLSEITRKDDDAERQRTREVLFDCASMSEIDYTIVQVMKEKCEELATDNIKVIFVNSQPQVLEILQKAEIENLSFYPSMETALQMSSGVQSSTEVTAGEDDLIAILASK